MGKRGRRKKKTKLQPLEQWLTQHSSYPPLGWINLPTDLTANILQRLDPVEILETAEKVCSTWRAVCRDPAMWRVIDLRYDQDRRRFRNFSDRRLKRLKRYFRSACRHAVDHSNGELVAIDIEHFGDDDLLLYISDRSSHLKCLRIKHCVGISIKGLIAAVTKLPELEELHTNSLKIGARDIQTIARFCPMLKCLEHLAPTCWPQRVDNRCALAIARHMPNLRQLGLAGNALGNGGVKAILDGCPRLESIGLWHCYNVHVDKTLLRFESINDHFRRLFDHSTAAEYDDQYWDDDDDKEDGCPCSDSWLSDDYFDRSVDGSDDGSDVEDDDDDDEDDDDDNRDDDFYTRHSKVLKDDFFKSR